MATTIGSLAVMLSANPEDFVKGLIVAGKKAEKFSDDTKKQLGPGLLAGLKQGFGSALGVAGVLGLGFGVSEIVGFVKAQADAIDTTGKLAAELGIGTEALVGLQHAADLANVSQEELTGGLRKFGRIIGEAASGSKEASSALALWGFSAQQLAAVPLNQALGQVADVIASIPNPTQQAAAAVDFFGKGAQRLLPFLKDGSAGLRAMDADARALFLTFSAAQFDDVQRMNDAITRVGSAFTGIARGAVIEFAPVIESLANSFTAMVQEAGGLRPIFNELSKGAADFGITFLESLRAIYNILQLVKTDTGTFFKATGIQAALDTLSLLSKVSEMAGKGSGDDPFNKVVDTSVAALRKAQEAVSQALAASGGGAALVGQFSQSAYKGFMDDMQKSMSLGIKTGNIFEDYRIKVEALQGSLNNTAESQKAFADSTAKLNDDFAKLGTERAWSIFADAQTPLESFNIKLAEMNELLQGGFINTQLYSRGLGKAVDELEKAHQIGDVKLPGALVQGSSAAASAIIKAEAQSQRSAQNPQKELKDAFDRAAKEEQRQTDLLRQQVDLLRQLNFPIQATI